MFLCVNYGPQAGVVVLIYMLFKDVFEWIKTYMGYTYTESNNVVVITTKSTLYPRYTRSWYLTDADDADAAATASVNYLLEICHCDPNCPTNDGHTPLDLARLPEIIRLLLRNGATPTYSHMKKCLPKHLQKDPADMAIKIFVLGNPGGGKSTLVKSIQTEAESFASRIKHQLTKVKGVDEKTAGIIPYDICSKTLGHIAMFDFAGHREYYAGHDALLRNSMTDSPSIIILVVDMKDEEGKIRETVEYWLEFLAVMLMKYPQVK